MPITITINDQTLTVEPGITVLEAARRNGIYIPTLCYAPKLPPFGGCRMCIVEIEKTLGFPTACTLPVADGMVVRTETPALQAQRRETFSLLLSEHPYTCLTCSNKCGCVEFQGTIRKAAVTTGCQYCPKNGQCEIQAIVDYLNLTEVPYPISYRGLPVEHDDPFFDRDMNLCIVCNRCVRACQDIRHAHILSLVQRGDQTIVGTAAGRSLLEAGCQFCGACVDVCPTGALFDKKSKWEGVPTAIIPSICPYCSVGCAVNTQVRDGRLLRAVGNDEGVTNDGEVCVRGRFGVVDIVHNVARLKTPLLKRGNRSVPVSWEMALDKVGQELAKYRGDQFAVIASATATNEELYLLQKFARTVMQSNNVALATTLPHSDSLISMLRLGGTSIRDIRQAATILVIGANPFESHPIVGLEIRHALSKGARLLTIDPRQTDMARQSTLWLRPRVGSDHVLLAGMMKVLSDADEVSLPASLASVRLDEVAAITGVSVDQITAAARLLTGEEPVMVIYGSGVTHQRQADETLKAIRWLASALATGIIGLPGEGNIVGAYDMGVHPALLPGYRPSGQPGRDCYAILEGIRQGEVKALYLAGDVPPWPELAGVPFLAVQAAIHNEITQQAHVVLPITTFAETDGTMTNLEGRVQRIRKAIEPVGQAQPGWLVVQNVANRLGATWNATSASDVLAEVGSVLPAYRGMTLDSLGTSGMVRRFEPAVAPSVEPLSLDGVQAITTADFPLLLIVERNCYHYGGVALTKHVKGLSELKQEKMLHVCSADAHALHIADGKQAKVTSAYGSDHWPVQIDNGLPKGTAFVSINPVVGSPIFPDLIPDEKVYAVRVEAET